MSNDADPNITVERTYMGLEKSLSSSWNVGRYRPSGSAPQPSTPETPPATPFYEGAKGNRNFWEDAANDSLWDHKRVELRRVRIAEWVPLNPGLYYDYDAEASRRRAASRIKPSRRLGHHYTPAGKQSMLDGGIGCARVGAVTRNGTEIFVMTASFNGSCDAGIPLLMGADQYDTIIEHVRDQGQVEASLSGRVRLLPAAVDFQHPTYRHPPEFYVAVESVQREHRTAQASPMHAAAFVSFREKGADEDQLQGRWLTSFCSFQPGNKHKVLPRAVRFLKDYVSEYGGEHSTIVADFDAYHDHFGAVDFSMQDRKEGRITRSLLQKYADETGRQIVVHGDYIEGSKFENIENSTIVNRSRIEIDPRWPRGG